MVDKPSVICDWSTPMGGTIHWEVDMKVRATIGEQAAELMMFMDDELRQRVDPEFHSRWGKTMLDITDEFDP